VKMKGLTVARRDRKKRLVRVNVNAYQRV
jgi:hypothetical protein